MLFHLYVKCGGILIFVVNDLFGYIINDPFYIVPIFVYCVEKSDEEKSQIAKAAIRTRTLNALKINVLEIKELLIQKNIKFDMVPEHYEFIYFLHNQYHPIIVLFNPITDKCNLSVGGIIEIFGYSELKENKLSEYIKNMLEK